MPTPALPEVEEAAVAMTRAVAAAPAGQESLWQIAGGATAGKTSCLERIADRLAHETDLKPILVSPPAHHLDAGPAALNDVAVGLADHGLLNGDFEAWQAQPIPWVERVGTIREWLTRFRHDVVLLCDEPRTWGANRELDDFFARRSFDAALLLSGLPCRRIVTGKLAVPLAPLDTIVLRPDVPDHEWLTDAEGWGTLAIAAERVALSQVATNSPTALQLRLLVAATALTSIDEIEEKLGDPPQLRQVVPLMAQTLRSDTRHRRLWEAWLALSLTRRSLDESLVTELAPSGLSALERDVVRHCLLYGNGELKLHDILKLYAARWRAEHQSERKVQALVQRTTERLFTIHKERFDRLSVAGKPAAVTEALEAFHFASASGEAALVDRVAPLFVEQLDALGWSLSYERRDFAGAAKAFAAALRWDEHDDYAHHYFAYNHYRAGTRDAKVETHYRRAIELNPTHPWWRSRLITLLLTEGRLYDARNEWEDALIELGVGEGDASSALYEHLHCWVAEASLDVGEARFAREVLDEVPTAARGGIEVFEVLSQRAEALLELGDGPAVVPGWRLRPEWWIAGPELLQYRLGTGEQLFRWLAGRVEGKDQSGLHVRVAVLDVAQESAPEIAWTEIPFAKFDELRRDDIRAHDLPIGAFLEIGLYATPDGGGRAQTLVRVLPNRHSVTGASQAGIRGRTALK